MMIHLVHDHFDAKHLAKVKAKMAKLGAPKIKAVNLGEGRFAALEGSHRVRAAKDLGLTPEIIEIEYSEEVTCQSLGLQFEDPFTVAEIVDSAPTRQFLEF